ncbi:uncharacterized protein LOC110456139 [Mizuhopecten yessoensis]|uniref:Collagen alpha-1(XIV) chain n=1 Tax=Mizuhopecten yessoensis TaxID=6573 RepID=A0A210QBL3_MIZYE|nr:uncharacterized protein LOC110456139 [Mizuhopecten yessoensis]OWF46122.1 Collagen alpha-1(XIV) chain [Mizuhopecten yessoensis]
MNLTGACVSLLCVGVIVGTLGLDQTLQPGGNGANVVEAVVSRIRESCLFADDKGFLRRLAYVQSYDGTDPKTYRPGYDGGIWQLSISKFLETKYNNHLLEEYNLIADKFNIDWGQVQWGDLRKPLYSGIAAALFTKIHGGVGWRIEDQAQFFANNFLSMAGNNFTNLAEILAQGCSNTKKIDLVFVMDQSNSLSMDDNIRSKMFIQDIVNDFQVSLDKTRVGLVTYSTHATTRFHLNTYGSSSAVSTAIDNVPFDSGTTATDEALIKALTDVFQVSHGSRPDAVKVLIVITDGVSNDRLNTIHAAQGIHDNNIVIFSIGVGSHINHAELNAIATSPSCTHVMTVSGYTDLTALKQEIQEKTCRAPVYIQMNHTYTCVMEECPPLAVITPPGGVTVETNVTCGKITLFTAFGNPFPGNSFYETFSQTEAADLGALFRNTTTTQTLFMSLEDALALTNGTRGCTINVTPYNGDHRYHEVKCYLNGDQIECPNDCKEPWGYGNICTKESLLAGITKFPHPDDSTKYLECDIQGKLYVVQCPQNESYYDDCKQCIGGETPCVKPGTPLSTAIGNPCSVEAILANKFFFTYPSDVTKFIHCDVWGKAWVRPCPQGEEWDQHELTCIVPSKIANPCRSRSSGDPFLYTYPCDPTKYIQCDLWHESFTRQCNPPSFYFQQSSESCVSPLTFVPTTPRPGTCDGVPATITNPAIIWTQAPQTAAPTNGLPVINTPSSNGAYPFCRNCALYTSPCDAEHIRQMKLYFPVLGDRHHYIQCDLTGHMYLQTCTNNGLDYFDPITFTCVDGGLAVDNQLGR